MTPGSPTQPDPEHTAAEVTTAPAVTMVPLRRVRRRLGHDHWWRAVQKKLIAARDVITQPLYRSRGQRVTKK